MPVRAGSQRTSPLLSVTRMSDPDALDILTALDKQASPGPWRYNEDGNEEVRADNDRLVKTDGRWHLVDPVFIVALRNSLPSALYVFRLLESYLDGFTTIETLRAAFETWKGSLQRASAAHTHETADGGAVHRSTDDFGHGSAVEAEPTDAAGLGPELEDAEPATSDAD
jgi:hypothetical protein